MIRNCTAQGNPLPPLRDWYDPWILIGVMIFFTIAAVALLALDLAEHFMGGMHKNDMMSTFKERLEMAYTTVPFYLTELRDAETYNKEVRRHGVQTDKRL